MRRFLLLGLLVYGLLLLGLLMLQRSMLALAIPPTVYLLAALIYAPDEPRLMAQRTLSARQVGPHVPVHVRLTVRNDGATLEELVLEDMVPTTLTVLQGEPRRLLSLGAGEQVELAYTVSGPRGEYEFDGVRVRASDHLGLFRHIRHLPLSDHLLVVPEIDLLHEVAIRPRRTHGFAGPVPARRGGPGVEFYGVREYHFGDPLRWVNWRASARHERTLYTNEYEQERITDVGLILDARQRNNVLAHGDSLLEHGVRATAALADLFLRDGNRVGLLIYGWYLDWTFPGYGKVQRQRIMRALARARAGAGIVFETLDSLPVRYFPARSQIVMISPLCPEDVAVLRRLRARGYQVLVVSPDPVQWEASAFAGERDAELAIRIARLERDLLLRRAVRVGVRVVNWPVDRPLDQTLYAALGRLPQEQRMLERVL